MTDWTAPGRRAVAPLLAAVLASLAWLPIAAAQDFPPDPVPPLGTTRTATPPPPRTTTPPPKPRPKPPKPRPATPAPVVPVAELTAIDPATIGPPELAEFIGPPALEDLPAETLLASEAAASVKRELVLIGETIGLGQRRELRWSVGQSFDGVAVTTPVLVVNGAQPGPRLCLTAAVHGDELNGVEVVRRVANELDAAQMSGTLIGVPIVNLMGFSRSSRYLPDRRDLNRYFPGSPYGSAASRIAFSLFKTLIQHCDALVDFHTGSFDRANLPQVRGDLTIPGVLEFTRGFGATPVLHSPGTRGMLRLAATDHGIPAVTFEVGAPLRLEPDQIDFAVQALQTLMHRMGMTRSFRMWAEPQATFYESKWVRANQGGMLFTTVALGDRVRQGQRLGKVVDPVQNQEHEVLSPFRGRVIGMALNQLVLPGFAAYHIGIETSEEAAVQEASQAPASPDALERLEGDEMIESLGQPRDGGETGDPELDPPVIDDPARGGSRHEQEDEPDS